MSGGSDNTTQLSHFNHSVRCHEALLLFTLGKNTNVYLVRHGAYSFDRTDLLMLYTSHGIFHVRPESFWFHAVPHPSQFSSVYGILIFDIVFTIQFREDRFFLIWWYLFQFCLLFQFFHFSISRIIDRSLFKQSKSVPCISRHCPRLKRSNPVGVLVLLLRPVLTTARFDNIYIG